MKYNITIYEDNSAIYEQIVDTLDISKIIAVVNSIPFTPPPAATPQYRSTGAIGAEPKRTNLITTNPNQHGSINC